MSRLDHQRPQLRLLDNLKREMGKLPSVPGSGAINYDWPKVMRPIAAKPAALKALSELMTEVERWGEDEQANIFSDDPPGIVKEAFRRFAHIHIDNEVSSGMTGRDWLEKLISDNLGDIEYWRRHLKRFE